MTRLDLPYLWAAKGKARLYHYYRRDGQRIPISAADGARLSPGDPGFLTAYEKIHASFEAPAAAGMAKGSLGELIQHFRSSPEFLELSAKARNDYGIYLDILRRDYGDLPIKTMPRDFVLEMRDAYAATPRKANYLLQTLRRIFNYALDRPKTFGVTVNPAAKPRQLKTGDGHRPWEEWEIATFRTHWPADTWERVAFELLLNTGQRRGDVAAMMRQHYQAGEIRVKQSKTGQALTVPASRDLAAVLEPWLAGHNHMAMLPGSRGDQGKPLTADAFSHRMTDAIIGAGLKQGLEDGGATIHGLRYTAATRLRELGLDWEQVADVTGHQTAEMARKYMRQRRSAAFAVTVLDAATRTPRKRQVKTPADQSENTAQGKKKKAPKT